MSAGAIEFYGLARDTPSTDTRTYWLVDGAARGSRIPVTSAGSERRSGFARSFPFTLDRKYRTIYSTLPNGERQNYFGDQIYCEPYDPPTSRCRTWRGDHGFLDVVVQGLTRRSHSVQVVLNGAALGTMTLSEQANVSHHFPLPAGNCSTRVQNSLTLTSTGGATDVSFIDTLELTYPRQYRAERGATVRGPRGRRREGHGFQPSESDPRRRHSTPLATASATDRQSHAGRVRRRCGAGATRPPLSWL